MRNSPIHEEQLKRWQEARARTNVNTLYTQGRQLRAVAHTHGNTVSLYM